MGGQSEDEVADEEVRIYFFFLRTKFLMIAQGSYLPKLETLFYNFFQFSANVGNLTVLKGLKSSKFFFNQTR